MRVFIIPSWFPSPNQPAAGIFFAEQAELYARHFPDDQLGLVSWGQNDTRLLLEKSQFLGIPGKLLNAKKIQEYRRDDADNYVEWFSPTFTWTRKFFKGNIDRIIEVCHNALSDFTDLFGLPEVIHAHVGYPGGYVAWKLAGQYNIPFVITEHMGPFPFRDFQKGPALDAKLHEPLRHSHQNLAVSGHLKKEMEQYGLSSRVFHNFIDDDFFVVNHRQPNPNKVKLLHVGRLAPEKRQIDLLHALTLISAEIDFDLTIVGDGPLRQDLTQLVAELGLNDRVLFLGQLNRVEVRKEIQDTDLMILSSNYENLPVSILEALACGKPVVATKCGGPEEMIDEVNGLLANPEDPKDLAMKIEEAIAHLANYNHDAIRRDFEKRFGRHQALPQLRRIYEEVIANYHSK